MQKLPIAAVFVCTVASCFAQLTPEQKTTDFLAIAGLYDKEYAPYNWKVQAFGYDMLKLSPWLVQVNASTDDLSFYDICVRYVASLNDFHDEFVLPSYYEAFLPFTVDIYDGKVLVDAIDTNALDPKTYPFAVGDELVSVDGTSAATWIANLGPYAVNGRGNPVSRNRLAAATILDRYQGWYTYANKVKYGDVATVVINTQKGTSTFKISWETIGIPLTAEGPVPDPSTTSIHVTAALRSAVRTPIRQSSRAAADTWALANRAMSRRVAQPATGREASARKLRDLGYLHPDHLVAGSIDPFGAMDPLFNPPPGFKLRLGAASTDNFVSGTFPVGDATVGFIRIPTFEPNDENAALQQFQGEIAYFQRNTSGLVIDVMGNGGGDICYTNNMLQFLFPAPFQSMGFSLRATEQWFLYFEGQLLDAVFGGAPNSVIQQYATLLSEVQQALSQNRGMTPPVPLCSYTLTYPPATDQKGNNLAYSKPILLLTNNFTGSAAETFSATLQDGNRATVYGERTSGGGGNVVEFGANAGPYGEGTVRVTQSLEVRRHNITTPGLPSAPYIENIGVYPDIIGNYQTKDNLVNGGTTFVSGFSAAIARLIGHE